MRHQRGTLVLASTLLTCIGVIALSAWWETAASEQDPLSPRIFVIQQDGGLSLTRVTPTANMLGLQLDDEFLFVGDAEINVVQDLRDALARCVERSEITFVVRRGGEEFAISRPLNQHVEVMVNGADFSTSATSIAETPVDTREEPASLDAEPVGFECPLLGLRLRAGSDHLVVAHVHEHSELMDQGVLPDDALIRWDGEQLTSRVELEELLARLPADQEVELLFARGDKFVVTTLRWSPSLPEPAAVEPMSLARTLALFAPLKQLRELAEPLEDIVPRVPMAPSLDEGLPPVADATTEETSDLNLEPSITLERPEALTEDAQTGERVPDHTEAIRFESLESLELLTPLLETPLQDEEDSPAAMVDLGLPSQDDSFETLPPNPDSIAQTIDTSMRVQDEASDIADESTDATSVPPTADTTMVDGSEAAKRTATGRTVDTGTEQHVEAGTPGTLQPNRENYQRDAYPVPEVMALSDVPRSGDTNDLDVFEHVCQSLLSSDVTCGGWLSLGYHSRGNDLFNDRPDQLALHQGWVYLEKRTSEWSPFGGRVDLAYGIDGGDTQAFGNPPGEWDFQNGFDFGPYAWAVPQAYGEVALSEWKVKLGHFFTPLGFETVMATENFFYSHAMTMVNTEPFTHTGVLGERSVSKNLRFLAGWTLGWDSAFDQTQAGSAWLGGFRYQFSEAAGMSYSSSAGNLGARGNDALANSLVVTVGLTEDLTWIMQSDHLRVGSTGEDNFGVNQYLFYNVDRHLELGARLEWWKGDVLTGYAPHGGGLPASGSLSYYAATVGVNYRPSCWFRIRPEIRYDWAPASDYDQAYAAVDAILMF